MIYAAGDDRILKLIHGKNVIKIVNCEVVLTSVGAAPLLPPSLPSLLL